jgi:adenylate cyclase
VFEQAGRASEFLRFVVEETLAGRGDRLKGYTIAVEVFEKPETFDAQSDPLVRVEAGRLRRRLVEYYHGDGARDRVRIELPRGGYSPTFSYESGSVAEPQPTPRRRRRWLRRLVAAGAVAVVTLLIWDVVNRGLPPADIQIAATSTPPPGPAVASGPRLLVLPFTNLSGAELDSFVGGLTEEIIRTLVAVDLFATVSPGTDTQSAALRDLRVRYDAGYALIGSIRSEGEHARIAIRVVDTELGTQLWTSSFDEDLGAGSRLVVQERIARSVAVIVSSPYGPVYKHEADRVAEKAADQLDPYECLLRFYSYASTFDAATHDDSVRCMQRAVLSEPRYAQAWSALAVLYLHEHSFGYSPQPDRGAALDRALEAARRALDIDGNDRVAAVAMAGIRLSSGDTEGFRRAIERALAITPVLPPIVAQVGYLRVLAGDGEQGLALVDQAIPETAYVPGWYYAAHSFRYLQTAEYGQALEWALKTDAPNWFATPMTAAAAAALAGRNDIAQRELARLLELDPNFPRTGPERLHAWGLHEDLRATLLEGLRLAGMTVE